MRLYVKPRLLLGCLVATVLAGCKGASPSAGPDHGSPDGRLIAELVENLADETGTPAKLKRLFAQDVAVDARMAQRYARFSYLVKGEPTISGTAATSTVAVRPEATGQDAVELEWSFVKEGDGWKIKTAPLP